VATCEPTLGEDYVAALGHSLRDHAFTSIPPVPCCTSPVLASMVIEKNVRVQFNKLGVPTTTNLTSL
jgi:hypothetical protein